MPFSVRNCRLKFETLLKPHLKADVRDRGVFVAGQNLTGKVDPQALYILHKRHAGVSAKRAENELVDWPAMNCSVNWTTRHRRSAGRIGLRY